MNIQNTQYEGKHTADATTVEEGLAIQEEQAKYDDDFATETAMANTLSAALAPAQMPMTGSGRLRTSSASTSSIRTIA